MRKYQSIRQIKDFEQPNLNFNDDLWGEVMRKGVGEEEIKVPERSNKRKINKFQVRWNKHTQPISPPEYNYKTWIECMELIFEASEE